jgi:hypothetical protein
VKNCPSCGRPGRFMFPPYWMHDTDADAYRCPLGNNWTLGGKGGTTIIPWPQWRDRRQGERRQS